MRRKYLSTEELAALVLVKPESIRVALCKRGHYAGLQPVKLANRRLAWPADAVERLLNGERIEPVSE